MIGGETGRAVRNSTGPGTPMPTPHSGPGRRGAAARRKRLDQAEDRLRPVGDVGRLGPMGEDRPGEVGERDVNARGAEVGDQQAPGRRVQDEPPRGPTASARTR